MCKIFWGFNLGQYKMEQLSPIPPKAMMKARRSKKRAIFGIIEMGGGVVQMFHLFCSRLYNGDVKCCLRTVQIIVKVFSFFSVKTSKLITGTCWR